MGPGKPGTHARASSTSTDSTCSQSNPARPTAGWTTYNGQPDAPESHHRLAMGTLVDRQPGPPFLFSCWTSPDVADLMAASREDRIDRRHGGYFRHWFHRCCSCPADAPTIRLGRRSDQPQTLACTGLACFIAHPDAIHAVESDPNSYPIARTQSIPFSHSTGGPSRADGRQRDQVN